MIHLYVTQCQGREKVFEKGDDSEKKTDLVNVCKIFYNFCHQHAGITVGGSWFQGQTVQQLSLKFFYAPGDSG